MPRSNEGAVRAARRLPHLGKGALIPLWIPSLWPTTGHDADNSRRDQRAEPRCSYSAVDKQAQAIEAHHEIGLGMTPSSDGNVHLLAIPYLTEELRKELIKQLHKKAEDHRVAVRNVRRDVNDKIKHQEKEHEISEDDARRLQDEVQKLTDKTISEIDSLQKTKESELLEV